jgi:hypothetical protein
MKYLLTLTLSLLLGTALSAQSSAIDRYFKQYVDNQDFSVVYVSPKVFQLIERIGTEELDLEADEAEAFLDLAADLRGLRILSTDRTPEKFFREARGKIDTKLYEPLVTVRDREGGEMEFLLKEDNSGSIEELPLPELWYRRIHPHELCRPPSTQ